MKPLIMELSFQIVFSEAFQWNRDIVLSSCSTIRDKIDKTYGAKYINACFNEHHSV